MSTQATDLPTGPNLTALAPPARSNTRWIVCGLLFAATTINYMDRSVLSLIEPLLHTLPFMGWNPRSDAAHQSLFNNNYGNIIICFQVAYGAGLLTAGRVVDKLGTRLGYAVAIAVWAFASVSHALVSSVLGFCVARALLGLGEAGNFPAAIKATTEWFPPRERALATGLFNSGSNASAFIAPALVAFVTARFGWRSAFLTTGSMGLLWLLVWLLFPYNRLRAEASPTAVPVTAPVAAKPVRFFALFGQLARTRGLYAFSLAKALTDPIWWFYLFYLPKFLHESYGLDLAHAYWPIVTVYAVSSVGSILGGGLSGFLMKRGATVDRGRKSALLVAALCVVPIVLVPEMHVLSPGSAWPAVGLFALAAAAHQGWSANLISTPSDLCPASSVSTVVGIGGAAGALGGAVFTWIVKHQFALHPMLIFALAGSAYLLALGVFQMLAPPLGEPAGA